MLPTQGLSPSEISMGQASLDALKVPETITLTGKDFPAFGKVVVTAGAEKLQASGASGAMSASASASASATGGKPGASLTMTVADTSSGVIGKPGITSISATSNPVGGGVVAPGVAQTSPGAVAVATVSGTTMPDTAKASNASTAKQAAATGNKSSASGISVASGCSLLIAGASAVIFFL